MPRVYTLNRTVFFALLLPFFLFSSSMFFLFFNAINRAFIGNSLEFSPSVTAGTSIYLQFKCRERRMTLTYVAYGSMRTMLWQNYTLVKWKCVDHTRLIVIDLYVVQNIRYLLNSRKQVCYIAEQLLVKTISETPDSTELGEHLAVLK